LGRKGVSQAFSDKRWVIGHLSKNRGLKRTKFDRSEKVGEVVKEHTLPLPIMSLIPIYLFLGRKGVSQAFSDKRWVIGHLSKNRGLKRTKFDRSEKVGEVVKEHTLPLPIMSLIPIYLFLGRKGVSQAFSDKRWVIGHLSKNRGLKRTKFDRYWKW
jgi:hypothetical protein